MNISNISNFSKDKILTSWWLLRITYGILFIAAGADKFFNLLTDWQKYVSSFALRLTTLELSMFILIVGVIEILIGLLILIPNWTKIGAYLAATWLIIIVINLFALSGYYDIAVRDTVMAVGAIVLGLLTNVIDNSKSTVNI